MKKKRVVTKKAAPLKKEKTPEQKDADYRKQTFKILERNIRDLLSTAYILGRESIKLEIKNRY